ncbi:MAG: hypothetical protein ABSC11_15075 [Smithella sp.]|jgi:hypothetical protein
MKLTQWEKMTDEDQIKFLFDKIIDNQKEFSTFAHNIEDLFDKISPVIEEDRKNAKVGSCKNGIKEAVQLKTLIMIFENILGDSRAIKGSSVSGCGARCCSNAE